MESLGTCGVNDGPLVFSDHPKAKFFKIIVG
jgi:hypothetical protein